jgi:ATP-dependent Clp protease ATP-binding subunit ClpA
MKAREEEATMYERFTDRARKVMQLANEEAQRLQHEYIGTEHILLGLGSSECAGVATHALHNLDIDLHKVRHEIDKLVQSGPDGDIMVKLPQTPRAKKVIEFAIEEARNFNHNYVGTEHLLLSLLREEGGVAAQVLMKLGLNLADVREEILNLLGHCEGAPTEPMISVGQEQAENPSLPLEIQEWVKGVKRQIQQLTEQKEAAVAEQDFEKARHLRDQADALKKKNHSIIRQARDELEKDRN